MRSPFDTSTLIPTAALAAALFGAACTGVIGGGDGPSGGAGGDGGTAEGAGNAAGANALLPARIRRLNREEFDNSVADVLGITSGPSASLAADARQAGYTRNDAQRIDATLGDQLHTVAAAVAAQVAGGNLANVVGCSQTASDCPSTFVSALATRAFRRPATPDESAALLQVFHAAADGGGTFAGGVTAVVEAILQSASFLYVPELGAGDGATHALDPYETASALSYFITAAPPDAALLDAARTGELATADAREAQMRRLLASDPRARRQVNRFVKEWLTLDTLALIDHPDDGFADLRASMEGETDAFLEEVLFNGDGKLSTLIDADFTMVDAKMAQLYGLSGVTSSAFTRVSLASTPRRGLLSQGTFLATRAAPGWSSPVKRGATVLRRLFCQDLPTPTGEVAARAANFPPPSPTITTRQRYETHSLDPACSHCHDDIDPVGFAFEEFDQVGRYRERENGQTVNAAGALLGTDIDGKVAGAADLAARLTQSAMVRQCFARNVLRFASAQSSQQMESALMAVWSAMPADKADNLIEIFVAFARSDLFVQRSVPQ
jgi:hypothetical protein